MLKTPMPIPSISVIIPAYNRASTIRYCLDSVLNQTVSPREVIVVDDRSTDNTVDIVTSYSDPRIRCIVLEKNSGAQAARNRGIREARGAWIAFQDSDDEWSPEKLERQIEALHGTGFSPMTAVHTDAWRYDPTTGNKELWSLPLVEGDNVYSVLLKSPAPLFPTLLTSKAALERIGFLDESVPSYQEWDTFIRLAKECRIIHLREPLFIYHLHSGETISKNKKRDIDGYQYIVNKFRDEILQHCGAAALNTHLTGNALKAMRWGYFEDAREMLLKTSGGSVSIMLLKFMAAQEKYVALYDRVMEVINVPGYILRRLTGRQ